MSYVRNPPYSVTLRPDGPALYSLRPKPISSISDVDGAGYLVESSGLRITSGNERWDTVIKWGGGAFFLLLMLKLYGVVVHDEPMFSSGLPPAWKVNP